MMGHALSQAASERTRSAVRSESAERATSEEIVGYCAWADWFLPSKSTKPSTGIKRFFIIKLNLCRVNCFIISRYPAYPSISWGRRYRCSSSLFAGYWDPYQYWLAEYHMH